jgi:hypothetical protein
MEARMKARKFLLIGLAGMLFLACSVFSKPGMLVSNGGTQESVPLYSKATPINLVGNDLSNLITDMIGYEYLLSSTLTSNVAWSADAASVITKEFDTNLPNAKWRLQSDWSPVAGSSQVLSSSWLKGNLKLVVAIRDNLSSQDVSDLTRRYGISGPKQGSALILTHVMDTTLPLPNATATKAAEYQNATSTAQAMAYAATATEAARIAAANFIPGLEGAWRDPETNDVHTIIWTNDQYVVTSTIAPDGTNYPVTAQDWSNGVLTWTYSVPGGSIVTFVTQYVSGDNLFTTWSNDRPSSGTETLNRVTGSGSNPGVNPSSSNEAIPGLAGKWQDPETNDVHTVVWLGDSYEVVSTIAPGGASYPVTAQDWSNGVLTWTYSVPGGSVVTFVTQYVSGDNLYTSWSNQSSSGTETLFRVP